MRLLAHFAKYIITLMLVIIYWSNVWFALMGEYAAYFDDSGHPADEPVFVVGGSVASEEQWLRLENDWRIVFKNYGVSTLHMTDLEARVGEYKGWGRKRKDEFLCSLVGLLNLRCSRHFCAGIFMDSYREMNREYTIEESIGMPYALAARVLVAKLHDWQDAKEVERSKLHVIFEDGTYGKGDLLEVFAKDRIPTPSFVKKTDSIAVLAADLVAWECFHAILQDTKKHPAPRPSMARIMEHDFVEGVMRQPELMNLVNHPDKPIKVRSALPPNVEFVFRSAPKRPRRRRLYDKKR